ncbi:MAG: hypothetical protein ABEJ42_07200 [Halobacteriaceae archaeon]
MSRQTGRVGSAPRDRGQTTTDFAIGASIFLLAVAFAFAFVPGMLDPFTSGPGQDRALVADRVADDLAGGLLVADPTRPYVLDRECTLEFFDQVDGGGNDPANDDCRYDARQSAAATVGDAVGLTDLERVQVTLARDVSGDRSLEVVCRDGTTTVVDDCSTGTKLSSGPAPTSSDTVVVAQRLVTFEDSGTQYTLFVRVW